MRNNHQILNWLGFFILGIPMGFLLSLYYVDNQKKFEKDKNVTVITSDSTLVTRIKELEEENEILLDELQFKESEISYWGRKYDDLKNKKND